MSAALDLPSDPTLIRRRMRRMAPHLQLPLPTLEALYTHDGLLRRLAASPAREVFALHGRPLGRGPLGVRH